MPKVISPNIQLFVPFNFDVKTEFLFRPIHYLGSKLRILDFIEKTINEIDPTNGRVIDLFAGSGCVSRKLSLSRPVTSVDIQEYSRVICSALLNPISNLDIIRKLIETCIESPYAKSIFWSIEPLIDFEKTCINEAQISDSTLLCDLLENGSIITYELGNEQNVKNVELFNRIKETLKRLNTLNFIDGPQALSIRYMGGIYFSYYQAAQIDILLHYINEEIAPIYRDTLIAALLGTISDSVNTVGKQFAQPIRPRNSNGLPKPNLWKQVNKDRRLDIFLEFEKWAEKYMSLEQTSDLHSVLKMDYSDALNLIEDDTTIVYADPPYTRDHYSRYYHTLETICLRDNPNVSTMTLNGKKEISRGLYREIRHQSPFCIKSQALPAFQTLISKVHSKNKSLLISYSPFDEKMNSHPRLLSMEQLIQLCKKYFKSVEIKSPGVFSHSKLTRTSKHLHASNNAELLIVCHP
jgi:adenine-specific DNA methylase